jgi:hypothetical protein
MKIIPGFIAGAVVVGFIVSKMAPEQRRSTARAASKVASKARSSQVVEAFIDSASEISEAAGERAVNMASAGTDTIAGTVAPDGSTVLDPSTSEVSASPRAGTTSV